MKVRVKLPKAVDSQFLFSIYVTKIGSFKSPSCLGDMKKVKKMELGMKHTQDLKKDLALKQDQKKNKMNPLLLLTRQLSRQLQSSIQGVFLIQGERADRPCSGWFG